MRRHFVEAVTLSLLIFLSSAYIVGQTVKVTTWHNDIGRTGLNSQEDFLGPSNLGTSQFGKVCSSPQLDGQVYAQPLVMTQLPIKNMSTGQTTTYPEVVFIATEKDSVYAFDPNSHDSSGHCNQIAFTNLLPTGQWAVDCTQFGQKICATVNPTVGILGTPVIDPASNTLYLVTQSQNVAPPNVPTAWAHRLHSLDITKSTLPRKVVAVQIGDSTFSSNHIQRTGLLLLPNIVSGHSAVYIGFSLMDGSPGLPNGYVYGFDATTLVQLSTPDFPVTPTGSGGGVWMGGAGLAAGGDGNGSTYLYFGTGDGTSDGLTNFGYSFLKVNTSLGLSGFFTPSGHGTGDTDFGSGGVVIIPDGTLTCTNCGHLAVTASKDHNIYLIDRTAPPGIASHSVETVAGPAVYHNSPAYYNSNLYYSAVSNGVSLYPLVSTCSSGTPPICSSTPTATTAVHFAYGTTPSVSTGINGSVVWAVWNHGDPCNGTICNPMFPNNTLQPAVLYAFTSDTLKQKYASSNTCTVGGILRDAMNSGVKFSVPTIANGKVYVATQYELNVYGSNPPTCQ